MILQKSEELTYFQFSFLKIYPITQAIFSRKGGCSSAPWHSLNVGNTVGDDTQSVKHNLERLLKEIGHQEKQLAQVKQVHSSTVRIVNEANRPGEEFIEADAMVTNKPGILLLMRFADCVPILLFDPRLKVIGILHAGWQGTLKKISSSAIKKMINVYHSEPSDIIAAIGPSIGPDHYEVGDDVAQEVKTVFGSQTKNILNNRDGKIFFDLWNANIILIKESGVTLTEVSGICTACNVDDWFSHRQERGRTGRFGTFISLNAFLQS